MKKEISDSYRGHNFSEMFFENFKKSVFYTEIYQKHKNELIIAVRDGYINIYYNCASIAKISSNSSEPNKIKGELASYYLTGITPNPGNKKLTGQELLEKYDIIKYYSNKKNKPEKKVQERLFIDNNMNPDSDWFCIDIEYAKRDSGWRFDIIAISRVAPFRVALIELKYGSDAIGGASGITKHIKDYYDFHKENSYEKLVPELSSIINTLIKLDVDVPKTLHNIKPDDFAKTPEYYFITLNNNKENGRETLPMETMAGYLFSKDNAPKNWTTNNYSSYAKVNGFHATVKEDKTFKPVFLFSNATLQDLNIQNIIDDKSYIKRII